LGENVTRDCQVETYIERFKILFAALSPESREIVLKKIDKFYRMNSLTVIDGGKPAAASRDPKEKRANLGLRSVERKSDFKTDLT
jgi:hypothetical protein